MELRSFDGKLVRITDTAGYVFEGRAEYCNDAYTEYLCGREEESLQLANFVICARDIHQIETIEDYSGPYGQLEELNAQEDIDMIDDILFEYEDEYALRMLAYLCDHEVPYRDQLPPLLERLLETADDENVRAKAMELMKKITETRKGGETHA